ncbi:MAG: hypothetical protein IPP74_14505 [Alphaproteobacteria bacterium]|nr:hypothetical protein [Alphaproteobacteria bacterium]
MAALNNTVATVFNRNRALDKRVGSSVSSAFAQPAKKQGTSLTKSSLASPGLVTIGGSKPKPVQAPVSNGSGSYSGVPVVSGTNAQIQSQVSSINNPTQRQTASVSPVKSAQPVKGLLNFPSLTGRIAEASTPNSTQTQLLQDLRGTAGKNEQIAENARKLSEQYGSEISRVGQLGAGAVAGNLSTGTNVVGSGNAAIASQSASSRMSALAAGQQAALEGTGQQLTAQQQMANAQAQALGGANTQQSQQIGGLGTAAGLAQPVQVPYSNQFVDPLTGQPFGGGSTGGLNSVVQPLIERVRLGQMSYDDAVSALSGYGQGGVNALNQALGSNFDVVGSNAEASARTASTEQTGTIGGQMQKGAETVKQHMVTLLDAYQKLGAQFGIPLINKGINSIAEKFGSGPVQSYNIALSNVRDELAKILGGGTSTDGTRATARELLPDNMTPQQIQASIKTATELMDSKIQEYTRAPGASSGFGGGDIFAEQW